MSEFNLNIRTAGSDFYDEPTGDYMPAREVARILRKLAAHLEERPDTGSVERGWGWDDGHVLSTVGANVAYWRFEDGARR